MVQIQNNNMDAQNELRACEVRKYRGDEVLEVFDVSDIQMAYHAIGQRIGAQIPVGGRNHTLGPNGEWDVMGFLYGKRFLFRNVRREGLDFGAVVAVNPDIQYAVYLKAAN